MREAPRAGGRGKLTMLEKLGNAIKKATDKISNAIFLDKDLVTGIVRDLQRALIEADVNIMLVKELSEKIKKTAFDEKIKGIEKKEHLIKLLHDELVSILGEKKELTLKEKGQTRIMMVGLYAATELFLGGVPTSMQTGYWASKFILKKDN